MVIHQGSSHTAYQLVPVYICVQTIQVDELGLKKYMLSIFTLVLYLSILV